MSSRAVAWAVLLLLWAEGLSAQAALVGTIRDDSSKAPVAGIEVVIQALRKASTTDSAGRFAIGGLAHGTHDVLVRRIGYRPIALRAYLITNDTLEVELNITRAPVLLPAIEVTATAIPLGLEMFEERRLSGFGHFVDWTALRRQEHRRASDLFRDMLGVRVRINNRGEPVLFGVRKECPMQLYVDGIVVYKPEAGAGTAGAPNIDLWNITELDAIEVYRGPSETPMQLGGTGANCGTVVLWTRRH